MAHFVKVEDEIELAHILECSVQRLNKHLIMDDISEPYISPHLSHSIPAYLNQVKHPELAFRSINDENKIKSRIIPIHDPRIIRVPHIKLACRN